MFDNNRAIDEGWSIFECSGSANGAWQLQKCDDSNQFRTDIEAWRHVVTCAEAGSAYHQSALDFLAEHNQLEYTTIMDTVKNKAVA